MSTQQAVAVRPKDAPRPYSPIPRPLREAGDKLQRAAERVDTVAGELEAARLAALNAEDALEGLKGANPDFVEPSKKTTFGWVILNLSIIATFIVDVFPVSRLIGPMAGKQFDENAFLICAIIGVVSCVFVVIWLAIAALLHFAKDDIGDGDPSLTWKAWTIIGGVAVAAISGAVATVMADGTSIWNAKSIFFFCITALTHGLTIFGGPHAYDAKGYMLYKFHEWRASRRVARRQRQERRVQAGAVRACNTFMRTDKDTRERFGTNALPPMQTAQARRLLEAQMTKASPPENIPGSEPEVGPTAELIPVLS